MSFRHNKKRNVALVCEFLMRKMSSQMIEGDKEGFTKSFVIFKRYFSPGSQLNEEKELFDAISSVNGVSEQVAKSIIDEAKSKYKMLNHRLCEIKKSNLIKDINYTFGKDFFSESRLQNYRLFASIQMILESCKVKSCLSEDIQRIKLEEGLIKFMMSDKNVAEALNEDKIDSTIYKLAEKKFYERYGSSLNINQKKIMAKYIKSSFDYDDKHFKSFINEEIKNISKELNKGLNVKEIKEDTEMKQRFVEISDKLKNLDTSKETSDTLLEEVMMYNKLIEELVSNE